MKKINLELFKNRVISIAKQATNDFCNDMYKDLKSLWDNNVLSNRKEIAKDAGCSRDAEYKTWSELDQKDKDILLKYWNIKESLSQEEKINNTNSNKLKMELTEQLQSEKIKNTNK